ncbi:MAG: TIGR00266 family protein [Candidatus Altiarchaeales archaeon]|nr:TIGR00266 family protein [Candidatus Altiarchaeales archaeon]
MEHEILYRPSYALLQLKLSRGEAISAEAGALVSMSSGIQMETNMKGGLLGGLKRNLLGGESMFINTFTAESDGELTLAPALPGDLSAMRLSSKPMYLQSGSYIASSKEVDIDTKWGGSKTFFSREGLFLLKLSGVGQLFASSYGAIHEVNLEAGQKYTVDTGHMVGFEEGVGYDVKRIGGLKSTLLSGEGLVVELTGPGKALIQTRSQDSFLAWLLPKIPRKK